MSFTPGGRLPPPPAPHRGGTGNGYARSLTRDAFGREIPDEQTVQPVPDGTGSSTPAPAKREMATDAIGRRAGALADELDFPAFVASLVHGTFDAIVDSSIRQMESFADLVSAVAKPLDQFAAENVTTNQVRDWLVEQHPADVALAQQDEGFVLVPRGAAASEDAEPPAWLQDYDAGGQPLSTELLEETILPAARQRVAQQRLQTLATMVLLGMNRVVVKDGTVAARLRFRATAADHAAVQYATSNDPGGGTAQWGGRGAATYDTATTKVSTVGVNVQSDSELKAELFGEVKINFASETVPLDRFIDEAQRTVLERHSRNMKTPQAAAPVAAPPPQPVAAIPAAPQAGAPA